MRTWHVLVGLLAFFGVFFVGLAFYFSSEGEYEANQLSRSQSSVTKKGKLSAAEKEKRNFEKSEIISKVTKLADEPSALFNDPAIAQAWGLKKADAARAWAISKGSRDIKVCIIDTGMDIEHEDLIANRWENPGETGKDSKGRDKRTNGIDDDNNGFKDDVYGWNFVSNNNDLTDNHGHGTHVAGILGAEAGNRKGISGVSPEVKLITAKYFDPKVPNTDNLKNTIASIYYCINQGAQIINYSGGGTEFSQEEHDAIAEAERKDILFVAAAGNEKSNSDQHHYYPADYNLKNIISVTAIDPSTQVLSSSNYGIETVDIAAPGQNILSTLPNNTYGYLTGTSQATPFVSAAAVLAMAHKKTTNAVEIKKYILATGDAMTSLAGKTKTSRQLNLFKALTILDSGVSASGVVSVHEHKVYSDPNSRDNGAMVGTETARVSDFGQSILKAIRSQNSDKTIRVKADKPKKKDSDKNAGSLDPSL